MKQNHGIWKDFFRFLMKAKLPLIWIVLAIVMNLSASTLSLLMPQYTQQFYAGDYSTRIILLMAFSGIGSILIYQISSVFSSVAQARIARNTRKSLFRHLLSMDMGFYSENEPKDMISRTTNDTDRLGGFISTQVPLLISSIYSVAGDILILFTYETRLVVAEIAVLPLIVLAYILNGRMDFKYNAKIQAKLASLTGAMTELVQHIPLIRAFAKEDKEEKRGNEYIDEYYKAQTQYYVRTGGLRSLSQTAGQLRMMIVILVGFYCVTHGFIEASIFVAFYLYLSVMSSH